MASNTSSYWLFFAFSVKHSSIGSERNTGKYAKRSFTRTVHVYRFLFHAIVPYLAVHFRIIHVYGYIPAWRQNLPVKSSILKCAGVWQNSEPARANLLCQENFERSKKKLLIWYLIEYNLHNINVCWFLHGLFRHMLQADKINNFNINVILFIFYISMMNKSSKSDTLSAIR